MIKKCISIIIIFALLVSMASALAPPKFEPQFFYTTDALVDWISRESFSTYQEGRFKEGLVEVKRNGEILVAPNEDLFDAKRRFIEILEDGSMAYYFYENKGEGDLIFFRIKLIEAEKKHLVENSLIDYFTPLNESYTSVRAQIKSIKVDGEDTSCILYSSTEDESKMVGFVKGDYSVLFIFTSGNVDFNYVNKLKLELVKLKSIDEIYTDVSRDDWFYQSVETVRINEYIPGTSETTFSPNVSADRATIAFALYNAGAEKAGLYKSDFIDVKNCASYYYAVRWAASNGIINGVGDNKFNPEGNVTRQDFAVMLWRYMKYKKFELPPIENAKVFADDAKISDYAKEAVYTLNTLGIMNGKGDDIIDPRGNVTRAEAAAMLRRMMKIL